ncbi:peptidase (plasmid) [Microbacterium sp. SGAir0570]|uniref:helix-turn-helix domain-containing protein n=1 Tax=Microbacterium sp. SGAir0570 TaxID=2070348 RepID=UPI0010CCEFF0|nr:XRE family transcriptional regulator [Microbacterium sp. SGAir0570]QCR42097.1 peptidase [Microbacterium sp. SGAir0570]
MSELPPTLFDFPSSRSSGRFEPARLTQARARQGLSKSELAAAVGVSSAAIGQYEADVNAPRSEVLERLARALKVHPDFFDVGRPMARIETLNAHFRSLRSTRVSDRQRALATTTLIWELTFALERYIKLPEADLPVLPARTSPADAAQALRAHWNVPDGPVKHLVATSESHGVVVVVLPRGEVERVDAFSALIVERPIVVTTPSRTENVFRHRFSIAHEIGHLLLHADSDEQSAAIEREADEFAAAFLTPATAMDVVLPQRLDLAALDRVGRTWGVSPHSLVRRMVERNRVTESSARRAYQRLAASFDPDADPTSSYPGEVPTLLRKAADLAAAYGTNVPALAELLRLPAAQVRDLLGETDARPVLRLLDGGLSEAG